MREKLIPKLVSNFIHPFLKECGFRYKGRDWNRQANDFIQVINIQPSKYNIEEDESFTINIGVFYPPIYNICWQKPAPVFVKETDCLLTRRIGLLMDEKGDYWWDIDQMYKVSVVANEILPIISTKVFPFLDRFHSLQSIHDFLENEKIGIIRTYIFDIQLAILKAELGDREGAKNILANLRPMDNPPLKERVENIAKIIQINF